MFKPNPSQRWYEMAVKNESDHDFYVGPVELDEISESIPCSHLNLKKTFPVLMRSLRLGAKLSIDALAAKIFDNKWDWYE